MTFKEANFGRRLWAIFLDSSASIMVASALEPHNRTNRFLLQTTILFLEIAVLTILQGASFGQMIARLRVVDEDSGGIVTIPRVLVRTLMILLVFPALFKYNNRALHDVLTHTVVVRYYKRVN